MKMRQKNNHGPVVSYVCYIWGKNTTVKSFTRDYLYNSECLLMHMELKAKTEKTILKRRFLPFQVLLTKYSYLNKN